MFALASTMTRRVAAAAMLVASLGCSPEIRDARPLTPEERSTFVARSTPSTIPHVDGLQTVGARIPIEATPAAVWGAYAVGFGAVDQWGGAAVSASKCLSEGEGELGAVRSCTLAEHMPMFGGQRYEEKIIGWDEASGYVAFMQTRASAPTDVLVSENWVELAPSGGTVLTSMVHLDLRPPASLARRFTLRQFKRKQVENLIGLKHFVETGERVTTENWESVIAQYEPILVDNDVCKPGRC